MTMKLELNPSEARYMSACLLLMRAEVYGDVDTIEKTVAVEGVRAEKLGIVIPFLEKCSAAMKEADGE